MYAGRMIWTEWPGRWDAKQAGRRGFGGWIGWTMPQGDRQDKGLRVGFAPNTRPQHPRSTSERDTDVEWEHGVPSEPDSRQQLAPGRRRQRRGRLRGRGSAGKHLHRRWSVLPPCHSSKLAPADPARSSKGCILHPRCTLAALAGPIVIGDCCIVEETASIINRCEWPCSRPHHLISNMLYACVTLPTSSSSAPLVIGSYNLFEVGCRIQSPLIGSYNTFEPKCSVLENVTLDDYCVIGAGCTVVPDAHASLSDWESTLPAHQASDLTDSEAKSSISPISSLPPTSEASETAIPDPSQSLTDVLSLQAPSSAPSRAKEHLPSFTVIYGSNNERRTWSGEGKEMQKALFAKHLNYLAEGLPRYARLRQFPDKPGVD